jgi:aryl-alcohol dehydrogenase-like predicted oxidoreductase
MGMSEFYGASDDAESTRTIHRALELGVTLLDTADMYGAGDNERLVGRAIAGRREQVVVATKFGNVRGPNREFRGIDGRPEYVREACEASLRRLGVETIDLYQQHRVDPKVPIEETVGAMQELVEAGKVRFLGLSEAQPEDLRRAAATAPIASVQTEYSLFSRDVERNTGVGSKEPDKSVLETCSELGIGFLAYAPLGRGMLTGRFRRPEDFAADDGRGSGRYPRMSAETFETNLAITRAVEEVAAAHRATAAQVALAWLLARRPWVVPIPGTRRERYLEENVAAAGLELTAEDTARLGALPDAVGARYPGGRDPNWVSPPLA